MFVISKTPLEDIDFKKGWAYPQAGALATFEGWVRNTSEGKNVVALEYDVFAELAINEGNQILKEAKKKFPIIDARCYHRSGKLTVGQMAVWVGVVAIHRQEAFKACRYIIDELKARLPIWKKEFDADGNSGWISLKTQSTGADNLSEAEYYSRQLNLPQVGETGQGKLKVARVLVVGTGGLGSPALLYLASAGIGTIGICEFDNLEISNLHRQIIFSHEDIGRPKSLFASKRLKVINPFIEIKIHPEKLTAENIESIIRSYDIILDCTDNFVAKYLLNDAAVLFRKHLIQASVYQFEGQIIHYTPKKNSACLRCLWSQIPEAGCVGACITAGVMGVVPGILGTWQATETIKTILGFPDLLFNEILTIDLRDCRTKKIKMEKNLNCPLCGVNPRIRKMTNQNYSEQNKVTSNTVEIDVATLPLTDLMDYEIIDVREPLERMMKPVEGVECKKLPFSKFENWDYPFDKNKKYLLFCEKGIRSSRVADELRAQGIRQTFSVKDGADAMNEYFRNKKKEKQQTTTRP